MVSWVVDVPAPAAMVVMATLFSSGDFRTTVIWYQPWTELSTNVTLLVAVICFLTILSTIVCRPAIHQLKSAVAAAGAVEAQFLGFYAVYLFI